MPITITENGLDLLLTNTKTNQHTYLHNPTWEDLIETLQDFVDIAENEPGPVAGPIVGEYDYVWQFQEHELTFYPGRATPGGWLATHLGTRYAHEVEVREDESGTISMIRDGRWTATDLPLPGEFFEELQAVSEPENPNLKWSFDDFSNGELVALIDINSDNEIKVVLYPDAWDQAMQVYVMG